MTNVPRGVNLHPSNHLPSNLTQKVFDIVVIGSGPVGRALCRRTIAAGLETLIVEKELYSGDCPFWACIPSKALLRPGEALEVGRGMSGSKQMINNEKTVDVDGVFARRDGFVQNWDDTFIIESPVSGGCPLVRGTGALIGEKRIKVQNVNGETIEITARHAVILATGSDPVIPTIPGLADIPYWSSRNATSANTVPAHLIIIGGGPIGCEMAAAFVSYGSKVTILSKSPCLLPKFEPEAGKRVAAALTAKGVSVLLESTVNSFQKTTNGVEAVISTGDTISGTTVLVSIGSRPRTHGIGLEIVGIDPDKLEVDDSLCVTAVNGRWLYAIGDTNNRNILTHMGSYQARAAALTILEKAQNKRDVKLESWSKFAATADHETCTQVVFTDPNVASVGLTVAAAKSKGIKVKEVAVPFMFPGAWVHAEFNYDGWAQWVIDEDKDVLVGATFIGREAADLLHASTVAIVGKILIEKLWHAVPSFPTMSEIYVQLLTNSGY